MRRSYLLVLIGIFGLLSLSACQAVEGRVDEAPQTPVIAEPVYTKTAPAIPEQVEYTPQSLEPTPIPVDQPWVEVGKLDCGEVFCLSTWSGWLERPVPEGGIKIIDRSYPYGSTGGGNFDPHRGVEFLNAHGTPVLAAGEGEVKYAGMDDMTELGPYGGFYGKIVVLRHPNLLSGSQDVYTLYAHLSEINVVEGDQVRAGDVIGKVGATGAAFGPHLHFEVRVIGSDYDHTVNPVLWFAPLDNREHQGMATLAGLILDQGGTPLAEFPLTLKRLSEDGTVINYFYPETYYPLGMNAHPLLGENFAFADIPAGDYRLAFIYGQLYEFYFTLESGSLGLIKIQLD